MKSQQDYRRLEDYQKMINNSSILESLKLNIDAVQKIQDLTNKFKHYELTKNFEEQQQANFSRFHSNEKETISDQKDDKDGEKTLT